VQQHNSSNYSQIKIHETDDFPKRDTPLDSALRKLSSLESNVPQDDKDNEADGDNAEDEKEDKERSQELEKERS